MTREGPGGAAFRLAGAFLLLLAAASGCSRLPKLIVLEDPLSADEHVALGVAYEGKGELSLAAREYERALKKESGSFRARVNLGNVRLAEKRYDAARDEYGKALALRPGDPEATNNLAWAAIRSGSGLKEATRGMEDVLSDPARRSPPLLDTLGVLLGAVGRVPEAKDAFDEALRKCASGDPSCTEAVRRETMEHRDALR